MPSKTRPYLIVIFVVSLVATLWSLYVSTYGDPRLNLLSGDLRNSLLGIPPCTLCRYVRIMLFPLVIISFIGLLKRDTNIRQIIMPFSILGFFISLYTYGLEMHRREKINEICGVNSVVDCSQAPLMYGGRITLAFAWLAVFSIIFLACLKMKSITKEDQDVTREEKKRKPDF